MRMGIYLEKYGQVLNTITSTNMSISDKDISVRHERRYTQSVTGIHMILNLARMWLAFVQFDLTHVI